MFSLCCGVSEMNFVRYDHTTGEIKSIGKMEEQHINDWLLDFF
jgi:hypothetical protein